MLHAAIRTVAIASALAFGLLPLGVDARPRLSDEAIKKRIIAESITSYPGNCPCPYNTARNGSRCGRRSAYSRAGGYAPLCFPSDVSKGDVQSYRQQNGL
mgnify:CR=1 FL=1